jgi:2-keto-4-pentenoate hydratase/2-oxohepta-3-ene-1,7-dioic acid hydratase in catechol pathway
MKVLCVGQNYAKHVRELGGTAPEAPVWFWKPDSAIIADGQPIELPPGIGAVHHEVELAVRIGREARRVTAKDAVRHLDALTAANDVTARDLQTAAKKAGRPWAQAKGYDTFLPLGAWVPLANRDLQALRLRLAVNGQPRQDAATKDMTWPVAELVALASQWTTLRPGDVLLTGTPDGVGPLAAGDKVEAEVVGVAKVRNPVVASR